MIKSFPIDFIRQILEQTLHFEHIKNDKLYGGKNQVSVFSFYEQLKSQDQVDRFVKTYRDLDEQQNRMNLIMNGVLLAPENPTITNIYSSTIIPLEWTCSFRLTLGDRDNGIYTINNLIEKLKGRKVDIAELFTNDEQGNPISVPFVVGTVGQNDGAPALKNGDFIGELENATQLETRLVEYYFEKGVNISGANFEWLYCENNGLLKVVVIDDHDIENAHFVEEDGNYPDIIFPPEHIGFEKWKMSLSFDAIRCDEPRTLNSEEYCELSFGGSATLQNASVEFGNDLIKINIAKLGIKADTPISFENGGEYPNWYLEPLEMPSGSNANTNPIQLVSNKFLNNTQTDALSITLQYSFIYDKAIDLLKQLFKYGRYGRVGITANDISPNMIFGINEIWSSWGEYEVESVNAKIVGDIDIENTESDTLTIGVNFQVQGENQ